MEWYEGKNTMEIYHDASLPAFYIHNRRSNATK